MRILLIRHADPEYVTDNITWQGRREASALARYLASDDCESRPTLLYTSPKGRAKATARFAERALGLDAEVEPWTKELSHWPRLSGGDGPGAMKDARPGEGGLALWDTAAEEKSVRAAAATGCTERQFSDLPALAPVAEEYGELRACSDMFLARHGYVRDESGAARYRIVDRNRDVIALFAHGGFGLTWLAILTGLPLMQVYTSFYLAPSSITTILFDERSSDWACPRILETSALPHLFKENIALKASKYEMPNKYKHIPGSRKRISGIKSNFY